MKRPRLLAIGFLLISAVIVAANVWLSMRLIKMERAEILAERRAEQQESVRLALWRMDSLLAPMIGGENSLAPTAFYMPTMPIDQTDADLPPGPARRFHYNGEGSLVELPGDAYQTVQSSIPGSIAPNGPGINTADNSSINSDTQVELAENSDESRAKVNETPAAPDFNKLSVLLPDEIPQPTTLIADLNDMVVANRTERDELRQVAADTVKGGKKPLMRASPEVQQQRSQLEYNARSKVVMQSIGNQAQFGQNANFARNNYYQQSAPYNGQNDAAQTQTLAPSNNDEPQSPYAMSANMPMGQVGNMGPTGVPYSPYQLPLQTADINRPAESPSQQIATTDDSQSGNQQIEEQVPEQEMQQTVQQSEAQGSEQIDQPQMQQLQTAQQPVAPTYPSQGQQSAPNPMPQAVVQQRVGPSQPSVQSAQSPSQSMPPIPPQSFDNFPIQAFNPTNFTTPEMYDATVSVMRPYWLDGQLVLARRATIAGATCIQGSVYDWPELRRYLLDEIADLLPNADLVPLENGEAASRDDKKKAVALAALPIQLVPTTETTELTAAIDWWSLPRQWSPLRTSLLLAWLGVIAAVVGLGLLMVGVVRLSERRAAFATAVTHEMRTPLTTFRIYTDMLAEGIIDDPQRRQDYLGTLQGESARLTHLVENVLAFARLERNGRQRIHENVTIGSLIDSVRSRLEQPAIRAKMELEIEPLDDSVRNLTTAVNRASFEQILANLVDNSCRYASEAEDRRIEVSVRQQGGNVIFTVADHGPGLPQRAKNRLFRLFSKTAQEAAAEKPGVGLGLALSRRLARDMGGNLRLVQNGQPGATFELCLKITESVAAEN